MINKVIDQFNRKYIKIGVFFIRKANKRECLNNGYWISGSYGMYTKNTLYHWITIKGKFGIMWHSNDLNYTDI